MEAAVHKAVGLFAHAHMQANMQTQTHQIQPSDLRNHNKILCVIFVFLPVVIFVKGAMTLKALLVISSSVSQHISVQRMVAHIQFVFLSDHAVSLFYVIRL